MLVRLVRGRNHSHSVGIHNALRWRQKSLAIEASEDNIEKRGIPDGAKDAAAGFRWTIPPVR